MTCGPDHASAVGVTVLQFGHSVAAVDDPRPPRWRATKRKTLQFGHSVAAVDDDESYRAWQKTCKLQFGHSVAAVDD